MINDKVKIVRISQVENNLMYWACRLISLYEVKEYTKETVSLSAVILALKLEGYKIDFSR